MESLFDKTKVAFEDRQFQKIAEVLAHKEDMFNLLTQKISRQITRTRGEESSPKNTTLYFNILTETKDLVTATLNLMEIYYQEYDSNIQPATL